MIKLRFKIIGMHCTSCAMNIDGELEDTEGVKESKTSYAKQETEVTFNPDTISIDAIISVIRRLDDKYDAKVINTDN